MKNKKKTWIGLGILGLIGAAIAVKKNKDSGRVEQYQNNINGYVQYNNNLYPIEEINAQSKNLNLTASAAQNALISKTQEGQVVELSIRQIDNRKSTNF